MFSAKHLVMMWARRVVTMRCRFVLVIASIAIAAALGACGASNENASPDAGIPNSVGPGGTCGTAIDCMGGNVCAPATRKCTSGLKCTTHTDCGNSAFCNAGTCAV